jgi:hypothetical protein
MVGNSNEGHTLLNLGAISSLCQVEVASVLTAIEAHRVAEVVILKLGREALH